MSSELNSEFMHVYDTLKSELVHDPAFASDDNSCQWVERMIDYNVPGGKMVRAFSVVDSCQLLKGEKMTEDEVFLACALGWCTEWLQASLVVFDDIMDDSHTRRGRSCWFRLPEVCMTAVNDGHMLRNHVHRILKKHFHEKAYYVHLVDLFNEAEFQTVCGQMIDAIATLEGKKDLSKYTMSVTPCNLFLPHSTFNFLNTLPMVHGCRTFCTTRENACNFESLFDVCVAYLKFTMSFCLICSNCRIFEYKSSYYSFYLPIACALLMFGENLDDHVLAKDVLIEIGIYYQVQNDYLDIFGEPNVFGKTGTDIEECKCSWLIVKAMELANEEQKKILNENYGMTDPEKVAKVKELYRNLNP
ncbi:chrysanthemyl diphosphate synthase [Artemisia annua]|uniref:Chrysanthemyl diphosphate synthase n=1 Tax=Artemisia annua TaxID=35608 RepID=A0A2U1KAT5_ARTAN|nr:chrysanthemyl diphosphate synthase [Artemisia annua]